MYISDNANIVRRSRTTQRSTEARDSLFQEFHGTWNLEKGFSIALVSHSYAGQTFLDARFAPFVLRVEVPTTCTWHGHRRANPTARRGNSPSPSEVDNNTVDANNYKDGLSHRSPHRQSAAIYGRCESGKHSVVFLWRDERMDKLVPKRIRAAMPILSGTERLP